MNIKLTYIGFLLFCSVACFSQNLIKDSVQIQKILKEEYKGKSVPGYFVISDKEKVDFIGRYIDAKKAEEKEKEEQRLAQYNNTLGRRYRSGDKSTIPQIITILKNKDNDKINTLLDELDNDYSANEKSPLVLDPEIKAEIFNLITEKELERSVVQFLGYNKVDGHVAHFEKRLLSGKSSDVDRVFYWLAQDGKSEKAIDYFLNSCSKNNNFEGLRWYGSSLDDFLQNGSDRIQQKILNFSFDYLERHPLTFEDFNKPDDADILFSNRDARFYFLELILKAGDKRILEIVNKLEAELSDQMSAEQKERLHVATRIHLLRLFEFAEQKELVLKTINNREVFFDVCDAVSKENRLLKDPEITSALFKQFDKLEFVRYYQVERFVNSFPDMTPSMFNELVIKNISSQQKRERLINTFTLSRKTLAETNDYLYRNGLISSQITQEQIQKLTRDEMMEVGGGAIYSSLELSGISHNFDAEPGVYPADHDVLLTDLLNKSCGKINKLKVYQQSRFDENKEISEIHLFTVYNNKCFVMIPKDFGDWYDLDTFDNYLNAIVTEAKIKERYIPVNTGDQMAWYIFGEPDKVEKLVQDYKLAYIEEGEE